ncbi:MAG: hypothetical protein J7M29_05895, partial [Verrucomicrobia bacterium]|nr:hypothetical protein [Verrucomicrobiota bacterium]
MKQTRSVDMKAAVIAAAALGLASALGAQPTQEVQQAARALARAGSYSWKTTMQFGQNRAGTLTGKYANRTAVITIPFRNQETQVVIRGR